MLTPFLAHQIPSAMKVKMPPICCARHWKAPTASSGYKVTLEKLKIHSVEIEGDALVVDADGG